MCRRPLLPTTDQFTHAFGGEGKKGHESLQRPTRRAQLLLAQGLDIGTSRRGFVGSAASAASAWTLSPRPARSIVGGEKVTNTEAAAVGAVGLWIDLKDCNVCRHDVPAACSGTLIAPDLVLSAAHCLEIPRELNGTLTKVIFGASLFDKNAASVPVAAVRTPADYSWPGFDASDGDLVLIKLARPAPPNWKVQRLSIGLGDAVSTMVDAPASGVDAKPGSLTDLIGYPDLDTFGFGDSKDEGVFDYSAGQLQRIALRTSSDISTDSKSFQAVPLNKRSGTCNGDSGGPALLGGKVVVGVLSSSSSPCTGATSMFVNPESFRAFIERASAELGSPVKVPGKSEWTDFLLGKG